MSTFAQPNIAFRTDASLQIGTGHVMRCLTLADALVDRGAKCAFICRPHNGHLLDLIRQRGHSTMALAPADEAFRAPADPPHASWLGVDWFDDAQQTRAALVGEVVDWLVVDHYALDRQWEQALRPYSNRLMVIDDLADRAHDCDLLLDQNLGRNAADYDGLIKSHTQTLIGPTYALLRPEFSKLRAYSLARRAEPQLKQLLVSMGGVDQHNATGHVLTTLQNSSLPPGIHITVVIGSHSPWLQQVQAQAAQMSVPTQVLVGVDNMAQLMADSDFAIGAAGSTSWERCCLGLPAALMLLAPNQQAVAKALVLSEAAIVLENASQIRDLFSELNFEIQWIRLQQMSAAGTQLTSGHGAAHVASMLGT